MSKHRKHVAKHRSAPKRTVTKNAQKLVVRNTVILSSVAVAATGAAVSGGLLSSHPSVSNAAADLGHTVTPAPLTKQKLAERSREVTSRSADRRDAADPAKKAALSQSDGHAVTHTEDVSQADPREIAKALLSEFGFGQDQFPCLDSLYTGESGWRVDADNPSSSAYGIPQALPGSKMASAGPDWETNPETQIRWGLGYISDRYGSPCGAMDFKSGHGWY